jgi:hypothetical protein
MSHRCIRGILQQTQPSQNTSDVTTTLKNQMLHASGAIVTMQRGLVHSLSGPIASSVIIDKYAALRYRMYSACVAAARFIYSNVSVVNL